MALQSSATIADIISALQEYTGLNKKPNLVTQLTAMGITASEAESMANLIAKVKPSSIPNLAENLKEGYVLGDITGTAKTIPTLLHAGENIIQSILPINGATEWMVYAGDKVGEIRMNVSGSVRVSFDMKASGASGHTSMGRIYINDVAVGTNRILGYNQTSYVTYQEDFNVVVGDKIQLYAGGTYYGATPCYFKNIYIKTLEALPDFATITYRR